MLMVQRGLDIIDGGVGHATALQHPKPLRRRLRACFRFDEGFERDAVLNAGPVGQKARVRSPFALAEGCAQYSEEAVIATTEEDIAIPSTKAGVGNDGC